MKPEKTAAPRARLAEAQQSETSRRTRISPPLAATDVPDYPAHFGAGGHRSRSRLQEAPSAGGGAGRGRGGGQRSGAVDNISALPDGILGDIVSLLPTKDAGRVPTLGNRWKPLWRSAPLNLDCRELRPGFAAADDDALAANLSYILSRHPGPGRRFCISTRLLLRYRPDTVDAWLQSAALDNLQELWISADLTDSAPLLLPLPTLPASIFRFAPSLSVATLTDCSLPDTTAQALHFPRLKKLGLEHVSISEDSVHRMLARCPVLECLLLIHSVGFRRVRINSSSLRSVGVSNQEGCALITLEEIIIHDAPCLERLLYLDADIVLRVSVISAPKLETLGSLNEMPSNSNGTTSSFVSSSTVIQGLLVIESISALSSVKMLAINMHHLSLDTAVNLMRCFPCLETLYIRVINIALPYQSRDKNLWRRKHRNFIKAHDIRLKKIVFLNYQGINSQVNFATFFILNAKMLKTMRFEGGPDINNVNFIEHQHMLLQLDKRASIDAQFHFTVSRCGSHLAHIKHVHDLSITNPFECTC